MYCTALYCTVLYCAVLYCKLSTLKLNTHRPIYSISHHPVRCSLFHDYSLHPFCNDYFFPLSPCCFTLSPHPFLYPSLSLPLLRFSTPYFLHLHTLPFYYTPSCNISQPILTYTITAHPFPYRSLNTVEKR